MAELHLYDVIVRPIVTERTQSLADQGKYVFEVALNANKSQIKSAVQTIFEKNVVKVNTLIMPAKRGQRGRRVFVRTGGWKKAIVTLAPGEEIELFNV